MQKISATMTPEEFLAWEREQPSRHHYIRGEIFDMARGSARHNRLGVKLSSALERSIGNGPCVVFSPDQKLGIANNLFVYADVSVFCAPIEYREGTSDVMTNPVVIVEVLSKGTEAYDRGEKVDEYLSLRSVRHVVLVSQRAAQVQVYTREDDGTFRYESFGAGATIALRHPAAKLEVDALYAGVFELRGDE